MPLSSADILKRGDDRLEALYQSIERGEPVDYARLSLLEDLEVVQFGRAFAAEASQAQADADKVFERIRDALPPVA